MQFLSRHSSIRDKHSCCFARRTHYPCLYPCITVFCAACVRFALIFFFVCLWYYFGCHSHNRKSLDIETRFLPFWYNIVYRLPHTNGFWRIRTHQKWSAKKNNETHVIKEWFFVISCFDCCCSRCFFSLSHFILLIWPFVWLKFGWSQWISIDRTIFALCVFLCLSHLLLVLLYRFTGPPK